MFLCGMWTCGSSVCAPMWGRDLYVGPRSIPLYNVEYNLIWVAVFALVHMSCCIHVFLFIRKSYSRSDVFSAGEWSDLPSVKDPELQQLGTISA